MEDRKADFLIAAYKAHKEEIAARRRTEIFVISFSALFYTASTAYVLLNTAVQQAFAEPFSKVVFSIILVLVANIVCYNLYKNYRRHCELQDILSRLDRAFGFFDQSAYIPERTLYPEDWKNAGRVREFSIYSRFMIVMAFALMTILALWVKSF